MGKHAILSASSSHRWLECLPSAVLEQQFENKTSVAAEEGTAAHNLCEHKLKKSLKMRSKRPTSEFDSDEMQECTDAYVSYILELLTEIKNECADPLVLIEQRLDFSNYVPQGFGTGDCVIVSDKKLHIIDFKYGLGVLVDADDNPQMKLYALGALELFDVLYDISEVSMTIFQPRRENISTPTTTADELKTWAENELKPKAELAIRGEGEFHSGHWCGFCRANTKCRARAKQQLELAQMEFKLPPLLEDSEIEEVLEKLPQLTKWANDITAYASDSAINHGKRWRGFKVVQGRSNRKYTDETLVAKMAKANGYKDIYKKSLITLTEMEKLMGKAVFNEILGELICKPKGKLSLVPSTDKRKEINVINEFKEETGE